MLKCMKKSQMLLGVLCVLLAQGLRAQDIHFSQFYMSPLNLNPAMTGVMNCNTRMVANYRNQWASILRSNAFRTYSVSYDQRIPSGRYDFFGVGGTFWGDRAGEANFSTMTGKVSLSYSKRMGGYRKKANYLVVGAEGGAAQRSIDFLNLRWGTQHDGQGGFDPTLDPQEGRFDRDNFIFADMAAGLLWFMVMDDNTNFYVGGAFHHLTRANLSFDSESEDLIFSRITAPCRWGISHQQHRGATTRRHPHAAGATHAGECRYQPPLQPRAGCRCRPGVPGRALEPHRQ